MCAVAGINPLLLVSKSRRPDVSTARCAAAYLLRELCALRLQEVGIFIGGVAQSAYGTGLRAYRSPGLVHWRTSSGFNVQQLARRAGVPRETISRIEHGRPSQVETIRLLADALLVVPSALVRDVELDHLSGEHYRVCRDCDALRPLRAYVRIKGSISGYYGRCKVCRARHEKAHYHTDARYRAIVVERSRRNQMQRKHESASTVNLAAGA